jgi:hypothetical protein
VEEVFEATLIADKSESFIDEEASNGSGRHSRILRRASA